MRIVVYDMILDDFRKPVLVNECTKNYPTISSLAKPANIVALLSNMYHVHNLAEEHAWLIAMDTRCHLKGIFELSHGTVDSSAMGCREIFVRLCLCGASQFAISHNHPSGDTTPSHADFSVTQRIMQAGDLMGIGLSDHIIIGDKEFYSMRENTSFWDKR